MGNSCPKPESTLGFAYNAVDSAAAANISAIQNILTIGEKQFCQSHAGNMRDLVKKMNVPIPPGTTTQKYIQEVTPLLTMLVNNMGNLSPVEKQTYIKAIIQFITVFFNNSSKNGGQIDSAMLKTQLLNIINSFCGNEQVVLKTVANPPGTKIPNAMQVGTSKSNFGLSSGAWWGIGGGTVLLILIIVGVFIYMKKHKKAIVPLPTTVATKFGRRRR
jgi:hypothetical protein